MDELNKQIDLILEHSLFEEQIGLALEYSLEEEAFLDERKSPKKKFNSFVQYKISSIRKKIEAGIGRNEVTRLIGLRRNDANKFKGAFKAKALDYVEEMEKLLAAREAGEDGGTTTTTPPVSPPTPPEGPGTDEELTGEELKRLQTIQADAIDLLTKRTILLGPAAYNNMSTINKVGRVIRKYFISKTALRALQEEEPPGASTVPRLRGTSASSESETADLLRQLSTKVLIRPEEAAQNFDKLRQKVKVKTIDTKWDALEAPQKEKQLDITSSLIRDAAFDKLSESMVLKEDKMVEIVIDFDELKEKRLDESFLAMFGGWVEHLLKAMFGGSAPPVSIRGTQSDVRAFAKALGGEKSYIDAAKRYGLDHPTTYKNKAKLDNAVKGFESDTGLAWPFK